MDSTREQFEHARRRNYLLPAIIFTCAVGGFWLISGRPVLGNDNDNTKLKLLESGWDYLPGVSPQPDGLHVTYLGRSIVDQDGKPGQLNPAINAYGTHLRVDQDFTVTAIMKDIKGKASLRLYDEVPIVQDEFRVEPKSLQISLDDKTLNISSWNGFKNKNLYKQFPAIDQTYNVDTQQSNTVSVHREGNNLEINLNEKRIATLAKAAIFTNDVWFGMEAVNPDDSWVLDDLYVDKTSGVSVANTQDTSVYAKSDQALQSLASNKRPGFLVGAAMALGPAVADKSYANIVFGGNFGQMTTENALKWQFIHPQPEIYDFREADALVDIAKKNNLLVHGHTLVFGEANPKWAQGLPTVTDTDKDRVKQVMVDHITQTVSHFKGKVTSWDVVNEPLADYDVPVNPDGLRQHKWYEALGESYIADAFKAARKADPEVKLYINEFGLEADDERWETFLTLVTKLKSQGVPIDGVGFEAHVYEPGDEIDPAVLKDHIRALAKLGLTARISEMDVHDDNGTAAQAQQYADVFNACITEPNCISWSTWGVTDRYDLSKDDSGRLRRGHDFLWDEQSQPTPAYIKIQQSLLP